MFDKKFVKSSDPIVAASSLVSAIENPIFPLNVNQIALEVGIISINEITDKNVEGILVALEDKSAGFINISKHIREDSRKRFTIAHELGHFLITTHDNKYSCNPIDINSFHNKNKPQENEANKFAAELLMPSQFFLSEIENQIPSYDLFELLTSKFDSSLQSTLIKYKDLSDESIAIVLSENSVIKWASRSDTFNYFIEDKVPLSSESYAYNFFRGKELSQEFEKVSNNAWFDASEIKHQIIVKELSIPIPNYNQVLSILWLYEDEDEIEEYDDFEDQFDGYLKLKE